jgi:hypothetical protein
VGLWKKFFNSELFFNRDLKVIILFSIFSKSPDSFATSNNAREYLSEVSDEKDLFALIF